MEDFLRGNNTLRNAGWKGDDSLCWVGKVQLLLQTIVDSQRRRLRLSRTNTGPLPLVRAAVKKLLNHIHSNQEFSKDRCLRDAAWMERLASLDLLPGSPNGLVSTFKFSQSMGSGISGEQVLTPISFWIKTGDLDWSIKVAGKHLYQNSYVSGF